MQIRKGSAFKRRASRDSGGQSLACHQGGAGFETGARQVSDLWWTERHWADFLRALPFPLPLIHSINCSTIIIIHHPGLVQ
jgi:hypothetical protein